MHYDIFWFYSDLFVDFVTLFPDGDGDRSQFSGKVCSVILDRVPSDVFQHKVSSLKPKTSQECSWSCL